MQACFLGIGNESVFSEEMIALWKGNCFGKNMKISDDEMWLEYGTLGTDYVENKVVVILDLVQFVEGSNGEKANGGAVGKKAQEIKH